MATRVVGQSLWKRKQFVCTKSDIVACRRAASYHSNHLFWSLICLLSAAVGIIGMSPAAFWPLGHHHGTRATQFLLNQFEYMHPIKQILLHFHNLSQLSPTQLSLSHLIQTEPYKQPNTPQLAANLPPRPLCCCAGDLCNDFPIFRLVSNRYRVLFNSTDNWITIGTEQSSI